jgi:chemotaxis protein methyltransferase CheR
VRAPARTAGAVERGLASFGDEAYSCAMLLADLQQQGRIGADWSILATDISDRVLRSAIERCTPPTGCAT